jgi:hypothetical protein
MIGGLRPYRMAFLMIPPQESPVTSFLALDSSDACVSHRLVPLRASHRILALRIHVMVSWFLWNEHVTIQEARESRGKAAAPIRHSLIVDNPVGFLHVTLFHPIRKHPLAPGDGHRKTWINIRRPAVGVLSP